MRFLKWLRLLAQPLWVNFLGFSLVIVMAQTWVAYGRDFKRPSRNQ